MVELRVLQQTRSAAMPDMEVLLQTKRYISVHSKIRSQSSPLFQISVLVRRIA